MKFLKFLFYLSYVLLVIWFYKTTIKPGISKAYDFFHQRDTTIILGHYDEPKLDTSKFLVSDVYIEPMDFRESSMLAKTNYLNAIFTNGSAEYVDSRLDADEYNAKVLELQKYLSTKFSLRQLQCVSKIHLINWDNLNDNVAGLTTGYDDNKNSYIDIAITGYDYKKTLLHEIWHCIHNVYHTYFHENHEEQWMAIDEYVTSYASTNMDEDVAETGCYYSAGTVVNGPKANIIKAFYKYTY